MPTLFPLRLMLPMLLIIAGNLSAEPPKVFNELADGVADARDGKRLLLFLLVENFAPESDAILTAVNDELANRGSEFTIVRCRNESADHRQLFQERFKQDPSKMPLGVIATPTGEGVTNPLTFTRFRRSTTVGHLRVI